MKKGEGRKKREEGRGKKEESLRSKMINEERRVKKEESLRSKMINEERRVKNEESSRQQNCELKIVNCELFPYLCSNTKERLNILEHKKTY
ncbi:hypothetical protein HMPREF0645_2413 [Hallella bergensis DSM 17361]|uniref:Uncharacterized protein n=1 Tax=Hallella bergensis DSM 17361 TaxID=585502 RepID=D1PZM8_9BACT|nr:hypothetical protein [Hallella bergensis]EFA43186.1 hypothetical protein HMPREF0645_2413 [Hallella bergensis DSM 17361]